VLLALPASLVLVPTPSGVAVHHRDVLWVPGPGRFDALPLRGPIRVVSEGDPAVVVGADGATLTLRADGVRTDCDPRRRYGVHTRLDRDSRGWTLEGVELPPGAARSPRAFPWTRGAGLVWADSGFAYRGRPSGAGLAVEVVGPIAPAETLLPGPDGRLAVARDGEVVGVAGKRGRLTDVARPVCADGSLRWDDDVILGRAADGEGFVALDAASGCLVGVLDDAVPTASARVSPGDGSPAGDALAALDLVVGDGLLAGPQGRVWELATLRCVGDLPVDGPVAACGSRWAGIDADDRLLWFDPRTGRTGRRRRDVGPVAALWGAEGVVTVVDPEGRARGLREDGGEAPPAAPPAPLPAPTPAWSSLGFDAAIPSEAGVVLASDDGLLALLRRSAGRPTPR
jgi:hypothetical protein